jgi:hypothetical protein
MLEYFWYAVGWGMGLVIVVGFQGLIWAMDLKNGAREVWRRVNHTPRRRNELKQILPVLDSRRE